MISRRCRRPSNNRLEAALESQVVDILRERYADFGPTLAAGKLAERHQIVLAKETVRRIQIDAGLWIPRKLRPPPKIQQPRTRRACVGELIQIDDCEHHWFEDRAPMCTALVFVDDATSRKIPRDTHDAHRPVRPEEDLMIFAWRELRKVSQNLILHYERKLYVLPDTPENRRLIGKYVEVVCYEGLAPRSRRAGADSKPQGSPYVRL